MEREIDTIKQQDKTLVVLSCSHERVRRERTVTALIYAQKNDIHRIIFAGGLAKNGVSEAEAMQEHVQNKHPKIFKRTEIILETESKNTQENIQNIDEIENGDLSNSPDEYVLITSASHIHRLRDMLPGVEKVAAEPIISQRCKGKTHRYHVLYWIYEFMRPMKQVIPSSVIERGKKLITKV